MPASHSLSQPAFRWHASSWGVMPSSMLGVTRASPTKSNPVSAIRVNGESQHCSDSWSGSCCALDSVATTTCGARDCSLSSFFFRVSLCGPPPLPRVWALRRAHVMCAVTHQATEAGLFFRHLASVARSSSRPASPLAQFEPSPCLAFVPHSLGPIHPRFAGCAL